MTGLAFGLADSILPRHFGNSPAKLASSPFYSVLTFLWWGAMIQTDPENIEQLRDKLRNMTDLELRKYGRFASLMSDPKKNSGPPNPAFGIQLAEARA